MGAVTKWRLEPFGGFLLHPSFLFEEHVVAVHGDNLQAFERVEIEQMAIIGDEKVCSAREGGLQDRAVFGIGNDFGTGSRFGEGGVLDDSTLRKESEASWEFEIVDEDMKYFVEHVSAGVDAPPSAARCGDDFAGGFSKQRVCDIDICIEEFFHRR